MSYLSAHAFKIQGSKDVLKVTWILVPSRVRRAVLLVGRRRILLLL